MFFDSRNYAFPDESSRNRLLNLQMPLAQGKDGKSFLNFGKNVFGVLINVHRVYFRVK